MAGYDFVVNASGGLLSGSASDYTSPTQYTLDTGESQSLYGPQQLGPFTAEQLSQISTQPFGTVNGVQVSLLTIGGQTVQMPTENVSSLIASIPAAQSNIAGQVSSAQAAVNPAPSAPITDNNPTITNSDTTVSTTSDNGITTTVTTTDTSVSTGSDGNSADNPTDPQQPAVASAAIPETQGDEIVVNAPVADINPGSLDDSVYSQSSDIGDDTSIPEEDTSAPINGMPPAPQAAKATWNGAKDLRAKLRVPSSYLVGPAAGPNNILANNGGILFPYTPDISVDNKADYAQQNPLHSIYSQYFYKNSSTGPISISAKFTVQNEQEGAILLGIIHLLRALTKMRFGDDPQKGSPPPVCRLDAYGDYMMQNVPVAVTSWKHTLPIDVDYITVGRPGSSTMYGVSMVPVLSTISIDLNIMYSRQEMLNFNIPDWLNGNLKGSGYL